MSTPHDVTSLRASLHASALASPHARKRAGEEESFLWAVSYSDLLMVLLCFSIFYFQFDDLSALAPKGKTRPPDRRAPALANVSALKAKSPIALPTQKDDMQKPTARSSSVAAKGATEFSTVCSALAGVASCKDAQSGFAVVLELPNNIYASGKYRADLDVERRLDKIVERWRLLPQGTSFTIIGHSDDRRLSEKTRHLHGSNIALASLRATMAANYLLQRGIPEAVLFAQGANNESRNSRSLSVVLSLPQARTAP